MSAPERGSLSPRLFLARDTVLEVAGFYRANKRGAYPTRRGTPMRPPPYQEAEAR